MNCTLDGKAVLKFTCYVIKIESSRISRIDFEIRATKSLRVKKRGGSEIISGKVKK